MQKTLLRSFQEKLGPGLMFAAVAVGVSHLVQSTRAGAEYGLSLSGLIVLICLIKYPAFRFGSEYANATGQSLLHAYEKQGRWALVVYALCFPMDMFVATAAIALVTSGIFNNIFHLGLHDIWLSCLLLTACAALLLSGRYKLFENVTKGIVILFSIMAIIAAALAIPELNWQNRDVTREIVFDQASILFMIAIAGWMPTGVSVSVFQSVWVCEKSKQSYGKPSTRDTRMDFNIGYFGSIVLALCFVLLGCAFIYNAGVGVETNPSAFASQLINMFTMVIGDWAKVIITIAAFAVMISTLLASLDACPRVCSSLSDYLYPARQFNRDRQRAFFMVIQVIGSTLILLLFLKSFKSFIDFATSIAFISAPILAYFNHRAMFSEAVSKELRPGKFLRLWSGGGIIIMFVIAAYYLYTKLF